VEQLVVYGMGLLWLTFLNILVGIFIAFVFFGKRTRKIGHNLGALTFPEFLSKRFNSRFIQWFSGAVIFFGMPLYAAVVLIGMARFVETTVSLDYNIALNWYGSNCSVIRYFRWYTWCDVHRRSPGSMIFVVMIVLLVAIYWMFQRSLTTPEYFTFFNELFFLNHPVNCNFNFQGTTLRNDISSSKTKYNVYTNQSYYIVVINLRIKEEIIGKEVLNGQAEVLGRVKDVEANEETNEIEALILSKGGISESLGLSSNEVIVPIEQVKQIGDKILLEDKIEYSFDHNYSKTI